VVVRYFGGTLLGKSGLINAYRKAAAECLNNAVIINRTIYKCFTIEFGYEQMNIVMRIIKEESIEINNKVFEKECVMNMSVRQGNFQKVRERMMKIDKLIFQEN
jgi:putative IMPACT (imprinted ancient) family translation regulator